MILRNLSIKKLMWALRHFPMHSLEISYYGEHQSGKHHERWFARVALPFRLQDEGIVGGILYYPDGTIRIPLQSTFKKKQIIEAIQNALQSVYKELHICKYTGLPLEGGIGEHYTMCDRERRYVKQWMQREDLTYEQKIELREWYDIAAYTGD